VSFKLHKTAGSLWTVKLASVRRMNMNCAYPPCHCYHPFWVRCNQMIFCSISCVRLAQVRAERPMPSKTFFSVWAHVFHLRYRTLLHKLSL
jgi:hypothetical protein